MSDNMEDLTNENKKESKAGNGAKKVADGAKKAAKTAQKMKKAGIAVKLVAALWWVVLVIVILFLLIGAYTFITTLPGMMIDKFE